MSDDRTQIERAIERAMAQGRISRRSFLRRAGQGGMWAGGALSISAILAACGIKPQSSNTAKASASSGASTQPTPVPTVAGKVDWANWPAYIDINDKGKYPTIEKFTKETGIAVTYTEDVNDNEDFFGKIQPDLAAGNDTGYDLIVVTDWMIQKMIRLGYLEKINKDEVPNFAANADPLYVDPWYDPGNVYSLAWQSGITGIGYNPKLTKREITKFDDLLDPAFKGRVGMFSEMRDTMCLTLLSLGVKPTEATIDDVNKARDKLLPLSRAGQFRAFYGNDYYDQLAGGNLALTIAWSGDITQMRLNDNPDVKFVIPDTGGMHWVDNMALPKAAAHPTDAHKLMNFWYDPANALPLSEYIGYYSPVKGIADLMLKDAANYAAQGDTEDADYYRAVANSINPSGTDLQQSYDYKQLSEDEEAKWNDAFQAVVTG